MKIIERIYDAKTGETTDIERDPTAQEIKAHDTLIAEAQAKAEAEAIKAVKKQEILDRLGITAEEAALLLA